ncbi:MAG: ketopantoate reductase C-terminal domain-containing protein, partial [Acidimicrobiales bacterium]
AVMRWKYTKLLSNLANAVDAACGPAGCASVLVTRATEEAVACYEAAGLESVEPVEAARRRSTLSLRPVGGQRRGGGSSSQSLSRATGTIEADWLNGEIVLLGRLHGVPTPVNALLQRTANRLARGAAAPEDR